MNGELAQLVALVGHGNRFLAEPGCQPPDLPVTNSTFRYVARAVFETRDGVVEATRGWFEWLRSQRVTGLSLRGTRSNPIEAGFSGGASGVLVSHGGSSVLQWLPLWEVAVPDAPDNRIWHVTYRAKSGTKRLVRERDVREARVRLAAALDTAQAVARSEDSPFLECFVDARKLLVSEEPVGPYHPDLLPHAGYSLDARQLLAASTRAWVFGGLGSWNDFAPDDPDRYQRVTRKLYEAVNAAIPAAVNSFDRSQIGSSGS